MDTKIKREEAKLKQFRHDGENSDHFYSVDDDEYYGSNDVNSWNSLGDDLDEYPNTQSGNGRPMVSGWSGEMTNDGKC